MRRTAAAITAVAVLMGTAGVASTDGLAERGGDEGAVVSLRLDDVWVDAERTFAKVDVDADGVVDVDEYAAQAVVYAGLARYEGVVPIDGREPLRLDVPRRADAELGLAERAAIDAVARADYYAAASDQDGLSLGDWVALRLEGFGEADSDRDGQLTGRELRRYASAIARYDVSRG